MASTAQIPDLPDEEVAVIFDVNDAEFNRCIILAMMYGGQRLFKMHLQRLKML